MNEDFLHFIWQHKLYPPELKSIDNQSLEVIHPGIRNANGGPDFFNAKIKIAGTLWAGNVEIHQHEKEWYQHKHHQDASYNNVILHVVEQSSELTLNSHNRKIPVCELVVPDSIKERYKNLYNTNNWIACSQVIHTIDRFTLNQWLERMLVERLEEKSQLINTLLTDSKNNWDQVVFILLARSFGFGLNGLPFEMMARQTPLMVLLKHSNSLFQIEALLFGQSGFLSKIPKDDKYASDLKKEYDFLRGKYQLKAIDSSLWQFLRLRPVNFPTVRIAQLANLIYSNKGCFDELLQLTNNEDLLNKLNLSASTYWTEHYRFGKKSSRASVKSIGKQSKQRLIYNTIIPYLFIYAAKHNNHEQKEKIIDYLYQQPAERNSVINQWREAGVEVNNEAQALSLLYLASNYCNQRKCLSCHIGHAVLCKT